MTAAQLALAWVLRVPEVFAIVKASTSVRVAENRAAMEITFSPAELERAVRTGSAHPRRIGGHRCDAHRMGDPTRPHGRSRTPSEVNTRRC